MAMVLVVDDSDLTHMLLDVMLRRLNHRTLSAYEGYEALEILAKEQIDLIISDIDMPGMDGLTLLDHLRQDERYNHIPVIIMTANGRPNQAKEATKRGASVFLHQPFRSEELTSAVGKCLQESTKTSAQGQETLFMGTGHNPTVSIGMAVFNGEKYVSQAIESILSQTYTDFELIISDNASNDRTAEICQQYAAQDERIRYSRNPVNIGGANNENLTFTLSRGRYFRWAAHDDICHPELIQKCVEFLDENPEVVLCHTQVVSIDETGRQIATTSRNNGRDPNPVVRFRSIAASHDFLEESYGLIRSDTLRRTRLQLNYTASDRTLICELALYGPFHLIEQPLFYKRFHPGNVYVDWRTRMAWFSSAYQGTLVFPFWMQFFDYFVTINRVPLRLFDKIRCFQFMLVHWFAIHFKNLVKDLLVAGYMILHSTAWRKKRYAETDNWS
jgi:CheY-like chemotaxis protein